MAIMVGSFTLQLPTSASVATLLAFAKPWRYRAFGGNLFMIITRHLNPSHCHEHLTLHCLESFLRR